MKKNKAYFLFFLSFVMAFLGFMFLFKGGIAVPIALGFAMICFAGFYVLIGMAFDAWSAAKNPDDLQVKK